MRKPRAAIVGAGLISKAKYVPGLRAQRNRIDLTAICDVDREAAEETCRRFGLDHAYRDVEEMLAAERPDLVCVCTPPRTHAAIALQAISHGAHVLIEKPMAMTVEECDEIIDAARRRGVEVSVAHTCLFYPPVMRAREMLGADRLGAVRGVQILFSTPVDYMTAQEGHWANRLPGGVIGETGPHIVYLTLAFIRGIHRVSVEAEKLLDYPWSPYEDYRVTMAGENGVGSTSLLYSTNQWMARVDVLATDGILTMDLVGRQLLRYRRERLTSAAVGRSLLRQAGRTAGNLIASGLRATCGRLRSPHEVVIRRFVDTVLEGAPPPVTVEEGRETVRILELITKQLQDATAPAIHIEDRL